MTFKEELAENLAHLGASHALGDQWISVDGTIPAGGIPFLGQDVSKTLYIDLFNYMSEKGRVKTISEWNAYVSEHGGNCPFYGYDEGATTFRMPKIVGYLKGANELNQVGEYIKEGLPNITGEILNGWSDENSTVAILGENGTHSGSLYSSQNTWGKNELRYASSNNKAIGAHYPSMAFDASRSNSIYGNSSHVTPETSLVMVGVYAIGIVGVTGYTDTDTILSALEGKANLSGADFASLAINGKEAVGIDSSGEGWIRYTNGLQIYMFFGVIERFSNIIFPVPFISTPVAFIQSEQGNQNEDYVSTTIAISAPTGLFEIGRYYYLDKYPTALNTRVFAIGYWK